MNIEELDTDELRRIRQRVLGIYLSLKKVKEANSLEKCTLNELINLKWLNSEKNEPETASDVENYIQQEKLLILAIEQLTNDDDEQKSMLDGDLDVLSNVMGKLSLIIEPYDYDAYEAVISERTSDLENSEDYEKEINTIFLDGIDLDIEMYDVHAMNYLNSLMFQGKMAYKEYANVKKTLSEKIERLKADRDQLFNESMEHLKDIKRKEKRSKQKNIFLRKKNTGEVESEDDENEK